MTSLAPLIAVGLLNLIAGLILGAWLDPRNASPSESRPEGELTVWGAVVLANLWRLCNRSMVDHPPHPLFKE